MPKLKTHRGAAKRFKKTGTGKFVRAKAFKRHILTSKTRSRKRALRGTTVVPRSARLRLRVLLVRMWRLNALARTNLPVPVFLKRFAAPR